MLQFDEYQDPMNHDWQVVLDRNVNDVQFENDVQEIIITSFFHSNKFFWHGILACVYFIAAVYTFLEALSSFFEKKENLELKQNEFAYVLPIAVILFDWDIRRVYRRREKWAFFACKLMYWAAFYVLYTIISIKKPVQLYQLMNFILLVFPLIAVGYTLLIIKFPSFTEPLTPEQNEDQYRRFE